MTAAPKHFVEALMEHVLHDVVVDTDGVSGEPFLVCQNGGEGHDSDPITIAWPRDQAERREVAGECVEVPA